MASPILLSSSSFSRSERLFELKDASKSARNKFNT
jgi:hypothetical protein